MAARQQSRKEELIHRLASSRAALRIPDTRQLVTQSKQLAHAVGRLPATVQARPARTALIVAGVACLVALVAKPRRRKKRERAAAALALKASGTVPRQLLTWSLTLLQPLARVWLTEQTRRWMKRKKRL
jgi:hypothetical protein